MGINIKSTGTKYGNVFLMVTFLVIILAEDSIAQRRIDCRKFVFAPPCRGIAAKRDTHAAHSADLRTPLVEDNYIMDDDQKIASSNDNERIPMVNAGLLGFLKRAMAKNLEYDPSSNYLV